jgi:prophage DNA circulation protein
MPLVNQLLPASFRGISFLYESGDTESGRKTITHEFPNQNLRFVEDLGGYLRKFTIRAVISGTDYFIKRIALQTALDMHGPGLLSHPYYGIIFVSVKTYTITEDNSRIGHATFSINFEETNQNTFPSFFGESISGISDSSGALISLSQSQIQSNVYTNSRNLKNNANKLSELSSLVSNPLPVPSSVDKDQINIFKDNVNTFNQNIYSYAQNSTTMAQAIVTLLDNYNSVASTPSYAYILNSLIFNYGISDKPLNADTIYTREINQNNLTLNCNIWVIALCQMFLAATEITYSDNEQLNIVLSDLDSKYSIIDSDNNLTEDIKSQLEDLRSRTKQFLTSLNINYIISTQIPRMPLTVFLYNYYENFDNEQEIVRLNRILDPSIISGSIKMVTTSLT